MIDLISGEALPENEKGEICVRGPQVMKGKTCTHSWEFRRRLYERWVSYQVGHYKSSLIHWISLLFNRLSAGLKCVIRSTNTKMNSHVSDYQNFNISDGKHSYHSSFFFFNFPHYVSNVFARFRYLFID